MPQHCASTINRLIELQKSGSSNDKMRAANENFRLAYLNLVEDAVMSRQAEKAEKVRRQRSDEALRAGEARLQLALDAAGMGIFLWNVEEDHFELDARMKKLLRLSNGDGLTLKQAMDHLHDDDRDRLLSRVALACEPGGAGTLKEDVRLGTGDSLRWLALTAHVIFEEDPPAPARIAGVAVDVTERKQHEEALREAKDAAERAIRSKDRFLAMLSHELRTPLTPALFIAAAMELDKRLPAESRENLAVIRRNIEIESRLIDDLLELTRLDSGKMMLEPVKLVLNHSVEQACVMCQAQAQEQNIRLERRYDPAAGDISADPVRLQQALWNVLKNAIKFGKRDGSVTVSTSRLNEDWCEVRVEDDGIGISAETLPTIFNAFEQGDPAITRIYGGLGLGLAITKLVIDLHGGKIRAESDGPGKGACFVMEFPVVTA
ncbi:MAG TPA: ATP-binding protein [Verrucomicrobiaceae bacterium]